MTQHAVDIQPKPLPAGWRLVRLGDVCDIKARMVDPTQKGFINLPHVNGENIESGSGQIGDVSTSGELGMKSGKYLFNEGDVLYSKLRPYLKKVAVAEFNGLCSADMYPIAVQPTGLEPYWLRWLLLGDAFTQYAIEESSRSRMPKLNRNQLMSWEFPLPPLEEQKRIAAILNEQMAAVEKAKKAAEERLEAARALPAAYLREKLISNKRLLPLDWRTGKIGDLLQLKHGFAFKSKFFSNDGPYVVLTPGNFYEEGGFRLNEDKQKHYIGEVPEGFILNRGDIIIVMTEQAPGLIGSCALVPESNLYLHNQRLGKVVNLVESLVHPKFLYHLFNTSYVRQQLETTATGSMVRHTSPARIYEVEIALPPVSVQERIIAELDEEIIGVKLVEESIQQEIETIEAMPAALLIKAFAGEL